MNLVRDKKIMREEGRLIFLQLSNNVSLTWKDDKNNNFFYVSSLIWRGVVNGKKNFRKNTVKPLHTFFTYDLFKIHTLPIHMIVVESVDSGRSRFNLIEIGTLKEMKV